MLRSDCVSDWYGMVCRSETCAILKHVSDCYGVPFWNLCNPETCWYGVPFWKMSVICIKHVSEWHCSVQTSSYRGCMNAKSWSMKICVKEIKSPGGGHSTLGYAPCATKKTLLLWVAFTERPPFLPTFTQWPPIFNKLLVTERPWHIFFTQRPLISSH